jgi:2-oxoacid:acceptor oxidoreductase delta subunit (pyruvate/2-ketoisovalerate family)
VSGLPTSRDLPPGGAVEPASAPVVRTGGWRSGTRPAVDLDACVNCLLCWIHCPDSAVLVRDGTLQGFDYDVCKGCEICDEMCPVDAIAMVDDAGA